MKPHQVILLFTVALFLASCTIPAEIELYNNSGEPITVEVGNETLIISHDSTTSFGHDYGIEFVITMNSTIFHYHVDRLALSNVEFVGWGPFTKRVFRAQLQADGSIWAVSPEQEYPVTNFIHQPEGFPVEPEKV